uniref:Uncharacterized protein n=1 Tax=Setaria viridis TaxID=4556 RepID=A0A4V6D139_SETVI|nr:hypothetical protein SEVIR_9G208800v2 [Setaria viridis]
MQVWHQVREVLNLHNAIPTNLFRLLDWWLNKRSGVHSWQRKGFDSAFMLVSWKIWKECNERVFARSPPKDASQLLHEIIQEGQLWCASGAKHLAAISWP